MHFFFNDTATTEIYTLSLHDALPIYRHDHRRRSIRPPGIQASRAERPSASSFLNEISGRRRGVSEIEPRTDRKSTRLNSSHTVISYAVFCLKKKKKKEEKKNKKIKQK